MVESGRRGVRAALVAAVMVALLMSVPALYAALPGLTETGQAPLALFLPMWNLLALVALLAGGSWIAARRRSAA